MKLGRLNHVGVATPDIDAAIAFYRDTMGATDITEPFDMPEQGVRVAFVNTPGAGGNMDGTQVELIAPLGENSPIFGFIRKNPLGGQHHVAFEVPDIHAAHDWFTGRGKRVLGTIRTGAHGTPVFFVHPRDMNGMLTEIMETPRHD
ncbi:methylmalonyl-CoA epimerase [Aurantiacibacter spongiae]|uniref:Methylmalonyl-CoA epimerase n=1 Tax=Aurantiacibacter spongiae TaxID=2488860 RepID=A0A3N5CU96_9SPHN|nr:methylmalonyl-CoA epimerase [Aurantiacibacter spongiae]RPF72287.1 methylmalonyl-CoA epimerase [Aurantiacibacter spongiae]